MQKFLQLFITAKHWQVFVILFGVPFIGQFLFMGILMAGFAGMDVMTDTTETQDPQKMAWFISLFFIPFGILMALYMGLFLGWFWALGHFCNSLIPKAIRPDTGLFRLAIFFPFLHIFIFMAFFAIAFTNPDNVSSFFLLLLAHLFAMYCMIYNLYFLGKNLTMAQQQKRVTISDYLLNIILIWFYPVGIWIIQPQLNDLFRKANTEQASPPPLVG